MQEIVQEELMTHPPSFPFPIYSPPSKKTHTTVRRSARIEEDRKRKNKFTSNMDNIATTPKEKLKIGFADKKDDIQHNQALSILASIGVTLTSTVRKAFQAAAIDDLVRAPEDPTQEGAVSND